MIPPEATTPPRTPPKRTTGGVTLGQHSSRDAKRTAAAILEVLAGQRTPAQAAEALELSLPRYYQLEAGGLRGLLAACEPKPKGRRPDLNADLAHLRKHNERLQRELTRQQSLVRLTQRAAGLAAPAPSPNKAAGKKARKRKPVVRALTVAERLRQDVENLEAQPSENGRPVKPE
jgi:hypothetical protein